MDRRHHAMPAKLMAQCWKGLRWQFETNYIISLLQLLRRIFQVTWLTGSQPKGHLRGICVLDSHFFSTVGHNNRNFERWCCALLFKFNHKLVGRFNDLHNKPLPSYSVTITNQFMEIDGLIKLRQHITRLTVTWLRNEPAQLFGATPYFEWSVR